MISSCSQQAGDACNDTLSQPAPTQMNLTVLKKQNTHNTFVKYLIKNLTKFMLINTCRF